VPSAMSVELHRRASGPKSLLLVAGANHGDAAVVGATEYRAAIRRLLPPSQLLALASTRDPGGGSP